MSTNALQYIPDHYVTMFDSAWKLLLQQMDSRIKGRIKVSAEQGSAVRFNQITPYGLMSAITNRAASTPITQVTMPARWVYPIPYDFASLQDEWDESFLATVSNPSSDVLRSQVAAYGRTIDNAIISALVGTATVTNTSSSDTSGFNQNLTTTTSALPVAQVIAANRVPFGGTAVTSGLTIDKVRYAKFKLDHAEAPDEGRYIVCSAAEIQDLLSTTEVTNQLYNNVKALVNGEVNSFLGFEFIRTELVPVNTWALSGSPSDPSVSGATATVATAGTAATGSQSAAYRACVAYQRDCAVLVDNGRKSYMDIRFDLSHALQMRTTAKFGAGRLIDNGVVMIATDTTKQ
jgi:Phage capsid protein